MEPASFFAVDLRFEAIEYAFDMDASDKLDLASFVNDEIRRLLFIKSISIRLSRPSELLLSSQMIDSAATKPKGIYSVLPPREMRGQLQASQGSRGATVGLYFSLESICCALRFVQKSFLEEVSIDLASINSRFDANASILLEGIRKRMENLSIRHFMPSIRVQSVYDKHDKGQKEVNRGLIRSRIAVVWLQIALKRRGKAISDAVMRSQTVDALLLQGDQTAKPPPSMPRITLSPVDFKLRVHVKTCNIRLTGFGTDRNQIEITTGTNELSLNKLSLGNFAASLSLKEIAAEVTAFRAIDTPHRRIFSSSNLTTTQKATPMKPMNRMVKDLPFVDTTIDRASMLQEDVGDEADDVPINSLKNYSTKKSKFIKSPTEVPFTLNTPAKLNTPARTRFFEIASLTFDVRKNVLYSEDSGAQNGNRRGEVFLTAFIGCSPVKISLNDNVMKTVKKLSRLGPSVPKEEVQKGKKAKGDVVGEVIRIVEGSNLSFKFSHEDIDWEYISEMNEQVSVAIPPGLINLELSPRMGRNLLEVNGVRLQTNSTPKALIALWTRIKKIFTSPL
eukprot:TRINITY_DN479_c0_g1_i4.p1 TRINITY_DN479_c0_g1~~TRINITY_DN479_c0_g1_i4.p1  ORF type:complete len:562 (-),score=107.38 TRINITY_DN479_c0_g1_i4:82-1767(-)